MHLPFKREKCYYKGVEDVGMYEQMLKAGLRFPFKCSSPSSSPVSWIGHHPNLFEAWRVFLGEKVLYEVMIDGARRMTVEEFFHCYRPFEITQLKGMYSFVPRSPLHRLVCDNRNSNRN